MKKIILIVIGGILELVPLYYFLEEKKIVFYKVSFLPHDYWNAASLLFLSLIGGAICIGMGLSSNPPEKNEK